MARLSDLIESTATGLSSFKSSKINDDVLLGESFELRQWNSQQLETILEMVQNDLLTESEMKDLLSASVKIFESVVADSENGVCPQCGKLYAECECSEDEDYDDYGSEDEDYEDEDEDYDDYGSEDGVCPTCGRAFDDEEEDEEQCCTPDEEGNCTCDESLEESVYTKFLHKTNAHQRANSRKERRTSIGIKARKRYALKRKRFANRFRNLPKGKTFSLEQ